MIAQNNNQKNNKKINSVCHHPGWWKINERWFVVRNSKNPFYAGPSWAKNLYDLIYMPEKGIFDEGHREEIKNAENKKKKIYILVSLTALAVILTILHTVAL